jgi:hypothetical protein
MHPYLKAIRKINDAAKSARSRFVHMNLSLTALSMAPGIAERRIWECGDGCRRGLYARAPRMRMRKNFSCIW